VSMSYQRADDVLNAALPETFELHGSFKFFHPSTVEMARVLWKAGDYTCYIDTDLKLKVSNGVVTAESSDAFSWVAGDTFEWCTGRYSNGKLMLGGKVESASPLFGELSADAVDSGLLLYCGQNDGADPINGLVSSCGYREGADIIGPSAHFS